MTAKYTAQERAEILLLAQQVGPTEAAKRKGVPPGTVTGWRCLENRKAKLTKLPEPQPQPQPQQQQQQQPQPQQQQQQQPSASDTRKRLIGKKVARLYTPSEKAAALELVQQVGVTETHRKTGISRFSLYEWARIHEKAMRSKHVSDPLVDETTPKSDRDAQVLTEWKKHPGLGPSQIRNQLRRAGIKISVRTVRMVMENNGYVLPKVKRKQSHDQRYEAIRPTNYGIWISCKDIFINRRSAYFLLSMTFPVIFQALPCGMSSAPRP
jgi:transposase-like protein